MVGRRTDGRQGKGAESLNENELKERAVHSLLQSKLGKVAPAEAFVIGWRKGWDEAIDMALEIVAMNSIKMARTNRDLFQIHVHVVRKSHRLGHRLQVHHLRRPNRRSRSMLIRSNIGHLPALHAHA